MYPPSFIVIGAQKCGTTSLYHYLDRHPRIRMSTPKGTHFFTKHYHKSFDWYLSHFPRPENGDAWLCGEATPMYLFDPRVPARMHAHLPDVRIIMLLRNPVDRAYSHFRHEVRRGDETRSVMTAFEEEPAAMRRELERIGDDEFYFSQEWQSHSYLLRGHYAEQLRRYQALFPADRRLILKSEELFANPRAVMNQIDQFLGLDEHEPEEEYPIHYSFGYCEMPNEVREWLQKYYAPLNEDLYRMINRDMGWNDR